MMCRRFGILDISFKAQIQLSIYDAQEIPNIIQYLGSAMGTLKDLDPARKDVWARNLTGLSGQYYGRLDVSRLGKAFL